MKTDPQIILDQYTTYAQPKTTLLGSHCDPKQLYPQ